MPKDPTKNVDRYKIRGGDINEFEYDQNQQAFADQKAMGGTNLIPGTPPEKKATKKSAKKQATRASKTTTRGASAKKLAARKAAKKK
jgi:hypothetical protein